MLLGGLAAVGGCVNRPVRPTLPGGGRRVFPENRLVGYCGAPGTAALGPMTGNLSAAARHLVRQGKDYATDRAVLPVVELIATVANGVPGTDRRYRSRSSVATVEQYLAQARAVNGLLLLNIQPGRADLLPEVAAYRKWLTEPDVGIALDPEWAVDPGVVPGQRFGHTTGAELDSVAGYLSDLVHRYDLPEKVLVYHQVAASVISREHDLRAHPGVASVKSVDGLGVLASKLATWRKLMHTKPAHVQAGLKLFFSEDTEAGPLMTPAQVLRLSPAPGYVMYE